MAAEERAQEEINPTAGIERPELEVSARPVDTFVKPATGLQLSQLSKSLSSLNPALEEFTDAQVKLAKQKGAAQGAEAFTKTAGDYASAVSSGQLPSHMNPFARYYAKEQYGRLTAEKYQSDMDSDPDFLKAIDGATTMQSWDQAEAQFRSKWDSTNLAHVSHSDSAFQNTFQEQRAAKISDARKAFAGEVNKNFIGLTAENLAADQSATIRDAIEHGTFTEGRESLVTLLKAQSEAALAHGISPRIVAAANSNALEQIVRDMASGQLGVGMIDSSDIWNIAKELPGTKDKSLYDDATYMGPTRDKTEREIHQIEYQNLRIQKAKAQVEKEETTHNTWDKFMSDLQAGKPGSMESYRDELAKVDPQAAASFARQYGAFTGATWTSNEGIKTDIEANLGLFTSTDDPNRLTRGQIIDQLEAHNLTPEDAAKYIKEIQGPRKAAGKKTAEQTAFEDPAWKQLVAGQGGFGSVVATESEAAGNRHTAQSKITQALRNLWEPWSAQNPKATWEQKSKFLTDNFNQLYRRLVDPDDQKEISYDTGNPEAPTTFTPKSFLTGPVMPQNMASQFYRKMLKGKQWDATDVQILMAYGLRSPADVRAAIQGQARIYHIKPPTGE